MRKSVAAIAINSAGALLTLALCAGLLPLPPAPAKAQAIQDLFDNLTGSKPPSTCEGERGWLNYLEKDRDRLQKRQAEDGNFSSRADAAEATARSLNAQAKQMNCDALLKGSAECLKQQEEVYQQARHEEYKVASLRSDATSLRDSGETSGCRPQRL